MRAAGQRAGAQEPAPVHARQSSAPTCVGRVPASGTRFLALWPAVGAAQSRIIGYIQQGRQEKKRGAGRPQCRGGRHDSCAGIVACLTLTAVKLYEAPPWGTAGPASHTRQAWQDPTAPGAASTTRPRPCRAGWAGGQLTLVKDDKAIKVLAAPLQQLLEPAAPAVCGADRTVAHGGNAVAAWRALGPCHVAVHGGRHTGRPGQLFAQRKRLLHQGPESTQPH